MNDIFQDILDTLQDQFICGRVDPSAYAAIKGSVLVCQQRLDECNIPSAIRLCEAVKAVINL